MTPTIRVPCLAVALACAAAAPLAAAAGLDDVRARFAAEIGSDEHPALDAPASSGDLRWDFAGERLVLYRLEQKEEQRTAQRMGLSERVVSRTTTGEGTMVVHSAGGDGTAEVSLRDLAIETTVQAGGRSESASGALPNQVAAGLGEQGRLGGSDGKLPSSVENLVAAMMALPAGTLARGESEEVPLVMGAAIQWGPEPGRMKTYPIVAEGTAQVTFVGYERVDDCDCARLDVTFEVDRHPPPGGFTGEVALRFRGAGRAYFDPRRRRLVEAETAMVMAMQVEATVAPSGAGPVDAGMTVLTDTLTRVRLGR